MDSIFVEMYVKYGKEKNWKDFSAYAWELSRQSRGWFRCDISKKLGVTAKHLKNIEQGHFVPDVDLLRDYAALTDYPLSFFFQDIKPAKFITKPRENYHYKLIEQEYEKAEKYMEEKAEQKRKKSKKKTPKDYPANWKEISLQIKNRDNWTCQDCGLKFDKANPVQYLGEKLRRCTVHHKDRNPHNCEDSNLVTLCCACHCRAEWPLIHKEKAEQKRREDMARGQQYFAWT